MTDFDRYNAAFADAERRWQYWMTIPATEFAEEIGRRMRARNMKRAELARLLGLSRAAVTKMLRGDANYKLSTLVKIALAVDGVLHLHISDKGEGRVESLRSEPRRPPGSQIFVRDPSAAPLKRANNAR